MRQRTAYLYASVFVILLYLIFKLGINWGNYNQQFFAKNAEPLIHSHLQKYILKCDSFYVLHFHSNKYDTPVDSNEFQILKMSGYKIEILDSYGSTRVGAVKFDTPIVNKSSNWNTGDYIWWIQTYFPLEVTRDSSDNFVVNSFFAENDWGITFKESKDFLCSD